MLLRLLRARLRPYRGYLTAVVLLQGIGVVAMLYLPSLNADIIDNGIATGDTGYIVRTGAVMLAISLLQIVCSVSAVWIRLISWVRSVASTGAAWLVCTAATANRAPITTATSANARRLRDGAAPRAATIA